MFHTPRFARTAGAAGPPGEPGDPGAAAAPVYTHIILTGTVGVTSGNSSNVSWTSEVEDTLNAWDSGDPTKIIVPADIILCRISTCMVWTASGSGRRAQALSQNGTDVQIISVAAADANHNNLLTHWIPVSTGDEFILRGFQNSGGSLNITTGTWLQAEWIAS